MVKNSKSFEKEVSTTKRYKHFENTTKFTSSVKKGAKIYKTLNNGAFEIEKWQNLKITKQKLPKDLSWFKLSTNNAIPANSKRNMNLAGHLYKYFGSFKVENEEKGPKIFAKSDESKNIKKNARLSKSSSKRKYSKSSTDYPLESDIEPETKHRKK